MYTFSGGNILCTVAGLAGSVFPDMLEGRPSEDEKELARWKKHHRNGSHWFVPYSLFAIASFSAALSMGQRGISVEVFYSIFLKQQLGPFFILAGCFLVGCILHIGEDYLCGHIPSLNPRERIGGRLFSMGSPKEYFISLSLLAIFLKVKYFL